MTKSYTYDDAERDTDVLYRSLRAAGLTPTEADVWCVYATEDAYRRKFQPEPPTPDTYAHVYPTPTPAARRRAAQKARQAADAQAYNDLAQELSDPTAVLADFRPATVVAARRHATATGAAWPPAHLSPWAGTMWHSSSSF